MNNDGLNGYIQRVTEEWIPAVARHRNADLARTRASMQRAKSAIERHRSVRPPPGDADAVEIPRATPLPEIG